ncbi:MAG: radical SAM protein [Deltaproteobacteria bacterium]|nr:radical SAM protein [Deltaproteobacteria bacterium]
MTAPWVLYEITRECNRACVYCYNRDRAAPRVGDLAPRKLEPLLDRLFAAGPLAGVTIIGGEPLTEDALEDVVRRFVRRGARVVVSTNALLLDRARLDALLDAGVSGFEVSLDSADRSTHAKLTGGPGVEQVGAALAELAAAAVPVTVGAMLTAHNHEDLDDLLKLCFALSVERVMLNQLAPVGGARARAAELTLSDGQLRRVLGWANQRAAELDLTIGIGLPVEPCRIDRGAFPNLQFEACRCGADKWVVEPGGEVRVCELHEAPVGNLHSDSLVSLAAGDAVGRFRKDHRAECTTCPDWTECRGGCRFLRPSR